jgi:hypothetical protein
MNIRQALKPYIGGQIGRVVSSAGDEARERLRAASLGYMSAAGIKPPVMVASRSGYSVPFRSIPIDDIPDLAARKLAEKYFPS